MGRMSFAGNLIARGGFIAWPPWLSDLTPPDFFHARTYKASVKPSLPRLTDIS